MLEENMRKAVNTLRVGKLFQTVTQEERMSGRGGGVESKLHYETLYIKTVESN